MPVSKLRKCSFLIGRNERNVSADNYYKSAQEFIDKMDRGILNGSLNAEIQKLSRKQLEEVVEILSRR